MHDDDYGIFGKGLEGYIRYTEAVEGDDIGGRGSGGGGQKPGNNDKKGCGCFLIIIVIYLILKIITAVFY